MIKKDLIIKNQLGLHARASNKLATLSSKFNSNIEIIYNDEKVDAIIFTFRNHFSSKINPHMYGWVKTDGNNRAINVSVKVPISKNPYDDHAIVGTFWFKKIKYFNEGLKKPYKFKI